MNSQGILRRVRQIIDEVDLEYNVTNGGMEFDLISTFVPQAVKSVYVICPAHYVNLGLEQVSLSGESNLIEIPEDSIRILSIRSDLWAKDIEIVLPYEDVRRDRQKYKSTACTKYNPMAFYLNIGCIEVYPFEAAQTAFLYYATISEDADIALAELDPRLNEAVCYIVAKLYLQTLGDERYLVLEEQSKKLIEQL